MGFSMNSPEGWYEMKNEEILKNLEEYDLTDEQLQELLKTNSKQLVTYTKYNPKKVAGIIPTIKVRTMVTQSKTIESFKKETELSTKDAMKVLDNFRFIEKPIAVKVSGKDALKFAELLLAEGKEVYIVDLDEKDPSEMGFENFTKLIHETYPTNTFDLMSRKIALL
jgi:hypothetical protein